MLRAIIFDCDGVIADTEPLHLATFQRVLAEQGIALTREDYYREYLALDDRGALSKAYAAQGRPLSEGALNDLVQRKASYLDPVMRAHLRLFPGVVDLIRRSAGDYPLAVASGALRREIEMILAQADVRQCFQGIVAAEDVSRGKPDPEAFLKAHALLNGAGASALEAGECLVIEDSILGIVGAHLAGMRCLAVTNSYPREKLAEAERVVDSLEGLSLADLEAIFSA